MSPIPRSMVIWTIIASLLTISAVLLIRHHSLEKAWRFMQPDLAAKNAELNRENELLERRIADLNNEIVRLKKYLLAYETNFIAMTEVLDRIGKELTKPIQRLHEPQQDISESTASSKYNYNLYTLYGKKLMDYSETLTRQSSIPLGPSASGNLDFFNRRMYDSLYELYQLGQDAAIDPSNLDLAELEEVLDAKF